MRIVHQSIVFLFWVSLVLFSISRLQIHKLPDRSEILSELLSPPVQTELKKGPFVVKDGRGHEYDIQPLFNYELYGLVVSYHHSEDDSIFFAKHKDWGDYLNTVDLCVVWGPNIQSGVYQRVDFYQKNNWTCRVEFNGKTALADEAVFRDDNLSNNHLLPSDQLVQETLLKARPGDQIRLKGQLVDYKPVQTAEYRKTSVTRDRACENVYVSTAEILKSANITWRKIYPISKNILVLTGLYVLVQLVGRFFSREV